MSAWPEQRCDARRVPRHGRLPVLILLAQRNSVIRPLVQQEIPSPTPPRLAVQARRDVGQEIADGKSDPLRPPVRGDQPSERDGVGAVVDAREPRGVVPRLREREQERAVAAADFDHEGLRGRRDVLGGPVDHFLDAVFAEPEYLPPRGERWGGGVWVCR